MRVTRPAPESGGGEDGGRARAAFLHRALGDRGVGLARQRDEEVPGLEFEQGRQQVKNQT